MTDACKHPHRLRTRNTRTTSTYLCVQCLARWKSARVDKVREAPRRWALMSQGELAVWYVRAKWSMPL